MVQKAHPRKKPKPTDASKWKHPSEDKQAIFVHRSLDEYGLDVYEFRILAHVARRESKEKGCFENQKNMAEFCGINQRKVMQALKTLCQAKILRVEKNKRGRSNVYRLNKPIEWLHPSELEKIRKGETLDKVATELEDVSEDG